MRKLMLLGAATLMLISAGPALAGNSSGGGAQRSALYPASNSGASDCSPSSSGAVSGFAILNTAGQPGANNKVVGVVSLKEGTQNTVYMVFLEKNSNDCGSGLQVAPLTTNGQGNGNTHIDSSTSGLTGPGTYWVHLKGADGTDFASAPVTLD